MERSSNPLDEVLALLDGGCKYTICKQQKHEAAGDIIPFMKSSTVVIDELIQNSATIDLSQPEMQWQLKPVQARVAGGNCTASFNTLGKAIDFVAISIDVERIIASINHAMIEDKNGERFYIIREE